MTRPAYRLVLAMTLLVVFVASGCGGRQPQVLRNRVLGVAAVSGSLRILE